MEKAVTLTPKEFEIITLLECGANAKMCANILKKSEFTVRRQIQNILDKTETHSILSCIKKLRIQGIIINNEKLIV